MATIVDGTIEQTTAYTLQEFTRRTGLQRAAIRKARQNGLKVRRCHSRAYVLGADWLDYLSRQSDQEEHSTTLES